MDSTNLPNNPKPGADGQNPTPANEPAPAPTQPVSVRGWFSQNAPFLLICVALGVFSYTKFGPEAMINVAKAALGLGFVIFIHELGHFLAAKWCDVHVVTFSIGFGPALPGCSFTRGETMYKIAMLPLGGYVNMVGEGPEADEDEDYPRSFKNKTVGQRMLIISAGVIMNLIFGALCFVAVYMTQGVERPPAIIWRTEPGSRAWEAGVQSGWRITQLGDKEKPYFDDMRVTVALSSANEGIPFKFEDRNGKQYERTIEPLKDDNAVVPVIGVAPPYQLTLLPERYRRPAGPVGVSSAAAAARTLELSENDVLEACTDPAADGKVTDLPKGKEGWFELCKRMQAAKDSAITLRVKRDGKQETIEVPADGFHYDDQIIGCTVVGEHTSPYSVSMLRLDPSHKPKDNMPDPFEFRERMNKLAGQPVVFVIKRKGEEVKILVPPAYHRTLGMRMKMGKIAGIRQDSPAAKAELHKGDVIQAVSIQYDKEAPIVLDEKAMDPVRLPYELERRITDDKDRPDAKKWQVHMTVIGPRDPHHLQKEVKVTMGWDPEFNLLGEAPVNSSAPLSIPQLGIAYWVDSRVVKVEENGPAAKAGLKANDEIQQIRLRERNDKSDEVKWSPWIKMVSKRNKQEFYDRWGYWFRTLQESDYPEVCFKVKRDGEEKELILPEPATDGTMVGVTATPDTTWPLVQRGIALMPDFRRQKTNSLIEALAFGTQRTVGFVQGIYLNLRSLITGRISTDTLGGPIEIATQAFNIAGENLGMFALFLGMISINLAVVNFLPIPVLDGGHMVFLVYEKLRGRPPAEVVRVAATYVGLAMILALMVFVFYLDIKRRWFPQM